MDGHQHFAMSEPATVAAELAAVAEELTKTSAKVCVLPREEAFAGRAVCMHYNIDKSVCRFFFCMSIKTYDIPTEFFLIYTFVCVD